MVVTAIGGWLLLPSISIDLPGVPPYDKSLAITSGILLGTILFDSGRLLAFRPRWYDLPMLVWCVCPFFTSISNNLGMEDGMSSVYRQSITWLFPYLIGRVYLTNIDSFRELSLGLAISGVCMIPFCLLEIRVGPRLLQDVYGLKVAWRGVRYGGYRPQLFFQDGLALGLWMNTATLLAWWLWRSKLFRQLWGLPIGSVILPPLLITSVLCKSTGATILAALGVSTLWLSKRTRSKWIVAALLAIAPTYCCVRITNFWTGQNAVDLAASLFGEDRAQSIEYRFREENVLVAHAMERPALGWGGYNRSRPVDESGNIATADSLWTIVLGAFGYTGLSSMTITMVLPVIFFLRRFPVERWDHAGLAPVAALTVVLALFLLDCLANAMLSITYLIIAGGLVTLVPVRIGTRAVDRAGGASAPVEPLVDGRLIAPAATTMPGHHGEVTAECAVRTSDSRERLAVRYQVLGRASKEHGQLAEAKAAWQHALALLTESMAAHPEDPVLRLGWCDCANDLAWLLASAADPAVRDPAGAVALAVKTVEMDPECSTYWNTLGAAHYRAGDFQFAIADLNQATALGNGGTTFDHVFLAMAHARLGHLEDARRWFDLAMIEMEHAPPSHTELHRLRDEAGSLLPAVAATSH
jgi:tetratricopeptide (TPR) repeat protein